MKHFTDIWNAVLALTAISTGIFGGWCYAQVDIFSHPAILISYTAGLAIATAIWSGVWLIKRIVSL